MKEVNIYILFLSETQIDDNISEDGFKIEGFPLEFRDRKGGTISYIKKTLSPKQET